MDFQALMRQAQAVQQKFQEAQSKAMETLVTGTSGGGLVTLELRGNHEIVTLKIDDSLMTSGESEVLADLVRAAHADALKKLEDINAALMQSAVGDLGPNGGLPKMPKFL